MKFSCSEITQSVKAKKNSEKNILTFSIGGEEKQGYETTLAMEYMKEIAEYQIQRNRLRVILIANHEFEARQAWLCLSNRFLKQLHGNQKEIQRNAASLAVLDDYSDLYEKQKEELLVKETVKVVTEQYFKAAFDRAKKSLVELEDESKIARISGNNVLYELLHSDSEDMIIDSILEQNKQCIAVMLPAYGASEYVIRRFRFEGEYDVIQVGSHSMQDYLNYAKRYVTYHGFKLQDDEALGTVIEYLQQYRGKLFTEEDIYTLLSRGMEKAFNRDEDTVLIEDLALPWELGRKSAMDRLQDIVGMESAKETIKRLLAVKKVMKNKNGVGEKHIHTNFVMAGNPGTGKSMLSRLYAKLLAEIGVSNGRFEDVHCSDLIGQYVGHTAPKVKEAFERAEGGVLFVDEASFLLGETTFVREAVIEFVRFMELYPETTVIFATYKQEAEDLLNVDPGFRSRISRIITFEDYSEQELFEIMTVLAKEYGLELDEKCIVPMGKYIDEIRGQKGFANGREVRKLLEIAMEEYALREPDSYEHFILEKDVSNAAALLLKQREIQTERNIGFV